MDFDPNAPAVVIGGPWHGLVYACSGYKMEMYDPMNLERLLKYDEAPDHILRNTRMYHREFYGAEFGSLKLSGWVWMWDELEPRQVTSLALGLLIAGLISK